MFCVEFCIKQWYMAGRRGRRPLHILGLLRKDDAPYGCLFGHGYKEGSVWNRPLHYLFLKRDAETKNLARWERAG